MGRVITWSTKSEGGCSHPVKPEHMVLTSRVFFLSFVENLAAMQLDVIFNYTQKIQLSPQVEYEVTLYSSSAAVTMSSLDLLKGSMVAIDYST